MPDETVPSTAITTSPDQATDTVVTTTEYHAVLERFGDLQIQYERVSARLEAVKGSSEAARARLIRPYAWAVLAFLSGYGGVVAFLLALQGFALWGFHIHDGVMGVVVGSTAVSAIGLVHTVVKGLFPSKDS